MSNENRRIVECISPGHEPRRTRCLNGNSRVLAPHCGNEMEVYEFSALVNSVVNDGPKVIAAVDRPSPTSLLE